MKMPQLLFTHFCLAISIAWAALNSNISAEEPIAPELANASDGLLWYDLKTIGTEGQGWSDTKAPFDRLPRKAEGKVRIAVWNLSRQSAGICARFSTDADAIHAKWSLTSANLAMPHMPATGVSGLDLYVRDDAGNWRWLANGRPSQQANSTKLVSGISAVKREYMLYLPLYNGVTAVEIGVANTAKLYWPPKRAPVRQTPILFYGTSITQGGCASRPGMVHTSILGRRFDRPVINLGFSGNGRMETEVVELIAEIDAAVYVFDCLPNISAPDVLARTKACIDIVRKQHPDTPILLVEDRSYSDSFLVTSKRQRNLSNRQALRKIYDELKAAGDKNLHYLTGEQLLGDDNEGTVDSSHPTDLGFMRQADAMAKVLKDLLP
jgi:hypothetical protein